MFACVSLTILNHEDHEDNIFSINVFLIFFFLCKKKMPLKWDTRENISKIKFYNKFCSNILYPCKDSKGYTGVWLWFRHPKGQPYKAWSGWTQNETQTYMSHKAHLGWKQSWCQKHHQCWQYDTYDQKVLPELHRKGILIEKIPNEMVNTNSIMSGDKIGFNIFKTYPVG